jgi:hypothetical protein
MAKKPDWFNDSDFDKEPVVIFKTETVHFLTFLDEGVKGTSILTDDDGVEKKVPCVQYTVKENDKELMFNPISKQLIGDLKNLYPLTSREFRIELQKGRTKFDNYYDVQEITK